jgi:hypothetical protein
MIPSKNDVLAFIAKYNDPKLGAIVNQVPITEENNLLIEGIKKHICPIRRRWRGKGWKWGHHLKEGAERVSIYPKQRGMSVIVQSLNSGTIYVTLEQTTYKTISNSEW